MTDAVNAAAARTANEKAMSSEAGSLDIREGRSYDGRRIFMAQSQASRKSLFADLAGVVRSDALTSDTSAVTVRIKALIWCIRILEEEAGFDHDKRDKMDLVMDTFLTSIEGWMDDLDEAATLARKLHFAARD